MNEIDLSNRTYIKGLITNDLHRLLVAERDRRRRSGELVTLERILEEALTARYTALANARRPLNSCN